MKIAKPTLDTDWL